MRILVVHGPNLNRLGKRNAAVYGSVTLEEIISTIVTRAQTSGVEIVAFQSNHEGELIDWLQARAAEANGVIINPGGLAHTSVALRDALEDTGLPVIEVHISDLRTREPFRQTLLTATAAIHVICGRGMAGYLDALDLLRQRAFPEGGEATRQIGPDGRVEG